MSQFYDISHNENQSLDSKIDKTKKVIQFFSKSEIVSYQTQSGIASITRMWIYTKSKTEEQNDEGDLLSIASLIAECTNREKEQENGNEDDNNDGEDYESDEQGNDEESNIENKSEVNDGKRVEEVYNEIQINVLGITPLITSTISINALELLFSILRHETPNLCDFELYNTLKKVIQVKFIYHLDENIRGFELPKIEISKHYNKLPTNVKTTPHNNLENHSPSKEKLKTIKAKIQNFNGKKQDVPITRDTHIVQKT
jgi:hypothetical protein